MDSKQQMKLMVPNIQQKEFQCHVCAKYFSRKFTLDAHMLIHKGEKPYTCQFCGKSFRQKGTLMRHKALHSSKNLFHCSMCNQGFRQKNVFIFHLRHRHNVSTETLDRRKYRTELKDYQSIMDTLPPFVHVDSAAIASSGEHFDALLSESIQKSVNSPENPQLNNLQIFHSSRNFCNVQNASLDDHMSSMFNGYENLKSENFNLSGCGDIADDSSEDVKPFINFDEVHITEVPFKDPGIIPADSENLVYSHTSNVTSSDDVNHEIITCIPCHLNFISEFDFKNHMKTHVQSVLLDDIGDIPKFASNGHPSQLSDDLTTLNQKTFKDSTGALSIKSLNKSLDSQSLKCPICNIYFYGENAFRIHSKQHDSFSLLKFIWKSFSSDVLNVAGSCSSNTTILKRNKKISKNLQNIAYDSNKYLCQVRKLSVKKNLNSKNFLCVQCDKKFPNKLLFEYHRQLHLTTKLFFCKCCKKNFSSKKLLLSHTRLQHMKIFTCSKCLKKFNYHRLFDLHQKQCVKDIFTKSISGSIVNFPIMSIESILNSDMNELVGIIPIESNEKSSVKLGIPVLSVPQLKAVYKL